MAADEAHTFGALLSHYRVAVGLTQEELAERANLSVRGISDLERGLRTRPQPLTVRRLADSLQLSASDRGIFEEAARRAASARRAVETLPEGNFLGALPATPIRARADEIERIQSLLDEVAEGSGHVLLLSGEVGVGKTRLLQELMVEARNRDYLVLTGRCDVAEQKTSYYPFLEALGSVTGGMPSSTRSEGLREWKRIQQLAVTCAERTDTVEQQQLSGAVAHILALASRSSPLVLLIDDLQWVDGASLKLLQHLAHTNSSAPILVAAAFRDLRITEECPDLAHTLQTLSRERLAERVVVRRLSLEETTQLVATTMGQTDVSEEFASFVYRRTKGVPRLIDQLVRSLGGRLELEGEIGAGAMGRVFRAHDRVRGEEVAAKLVLARQEIDLDALLRFQQEGAVLSKLDHPHIVRIYDTFAEEHASCIIMELLEGQSLGQILQEGPLPLARAKGLALQVADALAYAHSQEIVHRDIKPDNVMVLPEDRVKVTDFGIARILQPDTSLSTIATTGMRMGTPLYMAPEQIEGKKVDGRTDVYALGAMLYHMVTGRPPFEGSDTLAVAVKHLQEKPIPPGQTAPGIPADWDALILKAMAKDPKERFQSADQMRTAIAALGAGGASETTTSRRSWPLAAAAGVIALLAVLVGLLINNASGLQHSGAVTSLDAYLAQHHFSGYILLKRHGQVLLSKGYGMADKKAGLPNTIRSRWPTIGAGKIMTAIAILRLQDQRKVSVHDTICRYLTGCPSAWRSITINQLLLHTSGLGSFDVTHAPHSVAQSLAQCKALPVGAPVVNAVESTCEDLVLNIIISQVSRKPWTAAMQDLVFGPARMIDAGRLTTAATTPGRVQGFRADAPVQPGNTNGYFVPYASVQDLERMDTALLSGHLVSRGALHALFTPSIRGSAVLSRYFGSYGSNATQVAAGYEWYLRQATRTTVTVADKPGKVGVVRLDNAVSPDDGTIAIMAENDSSGPSPPDVLFGLASHLLWDRRAVHVPRPPARGARIAAYLARTRFNGYVYLERHRQVILSKGFGMADAEDKVPNTTRTKWPLFGMTRFLVGLAIMRLQEQGTLSIQDRVCRYMRGCPAAWHSITIRDLLASTSGIGSFDPFVPGLTLAQTLAACKANPLVARPGTNNEGAAWSDCNTLVLDTILERLTGKTWAAAMQEYIFGPAGMTNSGRMTNALKPPQRGRLYRAGVPSEELNYNGFNLAYTTVDDIIRLNHALLANKIVSRRSLDVMFTPLFHDAPNDSASPWRGYEVVLQPATATTYRSVCEGCVAGFGEDLEGIQAGFFVDIAVSPEAEALQIVIINDSVYFRGEDDNAFDRYIWKQMDGR